LGVGLKEAVRILPVWPVVLVKVRGNGAFDDHIVALQNSGCRLALWSMSRGDELTQSERERLIGTVDEFVNCCEEAEMREPDLLNALMVMMSVCRILVDFDSGMYEKALDVVNERPHIIPVEEDEVQHSVAWIESNVPNGGNVFGAVTMRLLGYLGRDRESGRNLELLRVLCMFGRRIRMSDEMSGVFLEFCNKFE
jgi:hypothetical protein